MSDTCVTVVKPASVAPPVTEIDDWKIAGPTQVSPASLLNGLYPSLAGMSV